ncbi:MAG: hypothetical protein QXN62_08190 [Candidatus Bathyarchaeia archaeon]
MAGLNYKNEMRVSYFLYKKQNGGAVTNAGGTKLSGGCILVQRDVSNHIISKLNSFGVKTKKFEIYLNENQSKLSME